MNAAVRKWKPRHQQESRYDEKRRTSSRGRPRWLWRVACLFINEAMKWHKLCPVLLWKWIEINSYLVSTKPFYRLRIHLERLLLFPQNTHCPSIATPSRKLFDLEWHIRCPIRGQPQQFASFLCFFPFSSAHNLLSWERLLGFLIMTSAYILVVEFSTKTALRWIKTQITPITPSARFPR